MCSVIDTTSVRYYILLRSSYKKINFAGQNTTHSNGNILSSGDSVLLTKDLKVKGFNKALKRGTLVKNIRITDDPDSIEGKVEGSMLVIKTMYLKKK
jgi:protein PhnA